MQIAYKPALQHLHEHGAIGLLEAFADGGERVQCLPDRACLFTENAGFCKRIVAADTDNQMACVERKTGDLTSNVGHTGAVERIERCAPAPRQDGAQLADDIGPASDISAVVENRVAEQNDVGHRSLSPTTGRNCRRSRQGNEPAAAYGQGCKIVDHFRRVVCTSA